VERPETGPRSTGVFREAWSLALLKVGAAEDEAAKALQRAGELAGRGEEEARKLVAELGERLTAQREELEKSIEDRINRAVARLKLPQRGEIEALSERLDRISERIDKLRARRSS
jgi:polyhydroxyalkanoate synthesis regulator phasin